MNEALDRKNKSIEILKKNAIPYIEHLPVIETKEETEMKTKEEIAQRAVCCLVSIQHSFDIINGDDVKGSYEFFHGMLKTWGLLDKLSPNEKVLFTGKLEENKIQVFPWRYEAYWVLVWALGFVKELTLPKECCDGQQAIDIVSQYQSFQDFLAATRPRTQDQILDEADLIFRIRWACVDASLKGQDAPAGINPDVAMERHMALNWLIGYDDDWDDTSIDT